jgi:hypothetical protein
MDYMSVMETSGNPQANITVSLPRRAGRPRGSKNRRTQQIEALLQPAVRPAKRLVISLLKDEKADMELRIRAAQLVLSFVYGKPRERVQQEITGKIENKVTAEEAGQTVFAAAMLAAGKPLP